MGKVREIIHPTPGGASHGTGMVPGVKAGGLLFFSAVRGNGPRGEGPSRMSDDPTEQAEQAFTNLRLLLEGAGATLDHVTKVTVFFQDLRTRPAFHQVWMKTFPEDPPARSAMQVANASATPDGNAHFVMDVIAVAP